MIDEQLGSLESMDNSTNPKELFEKNDIEVKTELTAEQVIIVARLKILAGVYEKDHGLSFLNEFIENFLTLQVSKDRGSRKEFVSAFQSKNDEKMGGLMDKFNLNLGK